MTLRKRILLGAAAAIALGLTGLAVAISHNASCAAAEPLPEGTPAMRAAIVRCYGPPEVVKIERVAKPIPADDQVLVKVLAASVNPLDWHHMRGEPYVMRLGGGFGAPEDQTIGVDFAGVVEAVGKDVTRFKPGDEVFGGRGGALSEYVVVRQDKSIALKPHNITFEEAAAVPVAAITALQGLRDSGRLQAGQKVLINGASGGVGTYAVQIAKSMGAEVTAVCSSRNVDLVRSLGANHVVDYTKEDFTRSALKYDLIIDNVGNRPVSALRSTLTPNGRLVIIGAGSKDPWIGPFAGPIAAGVQSLFVEQEMGMMLAQMNNADLHVLSGMLQQGTLRSVIDRRYSLDETSAAIAYLEEGRARGKVIVTMEGVP